MVSRTPRVAEHVDSALVGGVGQRPGLQELLREVVYGDLVVLLEFRRLARAQRLESVRIDAKLARDRLVIDPFSGGLPMRGRDENA